MRRSGVSFTRSSRVRHFTRVVIECEKGGKTRRFETDNLKRGHEYLSQLSTNDIEVRSVEVSSCLSSQQLVCLFFRKCKSLRKIVSSGDFLKGKYNN